MAIPRLSEEAVATTCQIMIFVTQLCVITFESYIFESSIFEFPTFVSAFFVSSGFVSSVFESSTIESPLSSSVEPCTL